MPYDDPSLKEFDNYYQARSASKRERAENWAVAIGLQKVDGLTPSSRSARSSTRQAETFCLALTTTALLSVSRPRRLMR